MAKNQENDFDFEIVDDTELVFAKRGRKSNVDPVLIEKMKNAPKGQRFAIRSLKISDAVSGKEIATEKARISAMLRSAAKAANRNGISIKWTIDNLPTVQIG